MFGLSISTVIGAHSADILDALFSFPVTSIDTKGRLHSFRQRFQVFMDNIYLTTCVFVNFFFSIDKVMPNSAYILLEILCMVKNKTSILIPVQ